MYILEINEQHLLFSVGYSLLEVMVRKRVENASNKVDRTSCRMYVVSTVCPNISWSSIPKSCSVSSRSFSEDLNVVKKFLILSEKR